MPMFRGSWRRGSKLTSKRQSVSFMVTPYIASLWRKAHATDPRVAEVDKTSLFNELCLRRSWDGVSSD